MHAVFVELSSGEIRVSRRGLVQHIPLAEDVFRNVIFYASLGTFSNPVLRLRTPLVTLLPLRTLVPPGPEPSKFQTGPGYTLPPAGLRAKQLAGHKLPALYYVHFHMKSEGIERA